MNVDDVCVPAGATHQSDRAGAELVKEHDFRRRQCEKPRDRGLPRPTSPYLGDHTGRNADIEGPFAGAAQKRANLLVPAFQSH
ncbi:MAG: hypothetical protein QM728_10410 [Gordonia sp. (in: high G+C Gram-positive bacteria)]